MRGWGSRDLFNVRSALLSFVPLHLRARRHHRRRSEGRRQPRAQAFQQHHGAPRRLPTRWVSSSAAPTFDCRLRSSVRVLATPTLRGHRSSPICFALRPFPQPMSPAAALLPEPLRGPPSLGPGSSSITGRGRASRDSVERSEALPTQQTPRHKRKRSGKGWGHTGKPRGAVTVPGKGSWSPYEPPPERPSALLKIAPL